ncbi:heme-binding protein [Corallincola luteus]|uniref:Heme-binding protein n=1 Tax=Corallincola luteus TaxID=1775177 RepID=A0ABY2APU1_9GAMM|nr:heme-binding protein [Corallincola luteus]TCI04598.1 heme-binding protein [Corallincola luteus]
MDISFSHAQTLLNKALELATAKGVVIAAAIVDAHGELVSFARMDGVAFHAAVLAQNKAYTSARDRQPSANLAQWAQETGKDMGYWSDARFTGIGGGVPIYVDGQVVGAIGISGMSEQDDAALGQAAIDAL